MSAEALFFYLSIDVNMLSIYPMLVSRFYGFRVCSFFWLVRNYKFDSACKSVISTGLDRDTQIIDFESNLKYRGK